jgi:hypothetical protein
MKTGDTLLHILGYIDGCREPLTLAGDSWQADAQAQAHLFETGALRIPNRGENPASRKHYERTVEALVRSGLLFEHGLAIGLTPDGDTEARRMAGLPTLDKALDLLDAIARSPDKWSGGWISESSLCGLQPLPPGRIGEPRTPEKKVDALTVHALPLLAARFITWRIVAGLDGVYLYRLTEQGANRAKGAAAKWWSTIRRPRAYTPPDTYTTAWRMAYHAREHAKPARPNLVHHLDPVDAP